MKTQITTTTGVERVQALDWEQVGRSLIPTCDPRKKYERIKSRGLLAQSVNHCASWDFFYYCSIVYLQAIF